MVNQPKWNILVVDDTSDNLRLLSETLGQRGYEVQCAINGQLALATIQYGLPDLILLDIKMPGLDGYEVCAQLKANPTTAQIPVIFLSALDEVQDKVMAFQAGGVDYVTKPFQVEEVLARVSHQLTIRQLQVQLQQQNIKLHHLNQDLTRSNQELEQFAYIVSHDLQQPLQTITGFAELLLGLGSSLQTQEELEEYVTPILEEGIRMQELIKSLLNYNRVETSQRKLEIIDCNIILKETLKKLQLTIEESGAIVTAANLPEIWGDRVQIGQLFQNLISNGIKYRRPGVLPKVIISATRKSTEWMFEIHDNGIGIKPENFNRIFQIFQRLHAYQDYPGNGIGLAICKKIVERHRGRLWVESEIEIGTSFYFTIPDQ
ncbi:MAG: response regulator [Oscillatoriales cyanobacterium RM2_1_1]|nr:response regulator [Oscillatoriales cyanobacterium SM2_3_0]NJO45702.1 response regulator [Oscillatoriales cyanobacterium RM2_1_1]